MKRHVSRPVPERQTADRKPLRVCGSPASPAGPAPMAPRGPPPAPRRWVLWSSRRHLRSPEPAASVTPTFRRGAAALGGASRSSVAPEQLTPGLGNGLGDSVHQHLRSGDKAQPPLFPLVRAPHSYGCCVPSSSCSWRQWKSASPSAVATHPGHLSG